MITSIDMGSWLGTHLHPCRRPSNSNSSFNKWKQDEESQVKGLMAKIVGKNRQRTDEGETLYSSLRQHPESTAVLGLSVLLDRFLVKWGISLKLAV